ncbi:MAG: sulfite exporter TauE/SafE family protein [Gemmatimonadaceae bacterium]
MDFLGYALAAVVGLSLGLLGGGGSILTVPIFVYVLGFDPKLAIAMSLPVVGGASLIGAASHWRSGNVDLRSAAMFGIIAMAGAFGGARLALHVSGTFQLSLLAVVMLAAAVSMFSSARRDARLVGQPEPSLKQVPRGVLAAVALAVGVLTGLVGIGGGFLIVPALVILGRVPMKQAVGTSLLVIAMNSLTGLAGYLDQVALPWGFMLTFMAIAAVGILIGTRLVRHVSQSALKQGFAVLLVFMGALILFKTLAV